MNQDHLFVTISTTHPNPRIGQISGIALVRTDRKGNLLVAFSEKVKPPQQLTDDEVDCSNGYVDMKAADFSVVMESISEKVFEPYDKQFVVITAAETDTVKTFITQTAKDAAVRKKHCGRLISNPWVDALQVAWPLVHSGMIPVSDLDSVCKHFRVVNPAPDTPAGDCEALVRVYWDMMKRFNAALLGEEVMREVGGKPLAFIRNILGR